MNELLAQLFGSQPSYAGQLLGEDEARRLQQQAQQSGLLNVGLALLAGAGPSPQRRGVGELLAQGVMAGQQAYQGAYSKAVQERALMEQLAERRQAQADIQAAQQAIQGAFAPREMYGEDIMGQRVGVGMTAPMLDMTRLQSMLGGLTPGARSQVLKEAGAIQSAFAPKRITAKEGERILEEAPGGGLQQVYAVPPKPEKAPASIQEYQFAVNQGFKGSYEDFKKLGTPTTNVQVSTGKTFGAEMAKGIAESVQNTFNQATAASDTLGTIETLKPILQQGNVFSGPGTEQQLLWTRIGTKLGISGQDDQQKAQNTVVAMQQLAGLELQSASAMKGQGAITENERSLIARAAAGDITKFSSGEVAALLNAMEKTSKFRIQLHQRNLGILKKKPEFQDLVDLYELPARTIPLSAL
jgi:hypothetical protein